MHFQDWLISENTTAQELKRYPKELMSRLKNLVVWKVLEMQGKQMFLDLVGEQYGNRIINKLTEFVIEFILQWQDSHLAFIAAQAKDAPLKKRVQLLNDYLESDDFEKERPNELPPFQSLRTKLIAFGVLDYLRFATDEPDIKEYLMSKLNNPDYEIWDLDADAGRWHDAIARQEKGEGKARKGRELGIKSGPYHWVSLDRTHCQQEAGAAGHCGNANYEEGDNILSLRDDEDKVYATFVTNGGLLKEAKGRFNKPPGKELHQAIVALLLSNKYGHRHIEAMHSKGYIDLDREINDFHLSDLSPSLRKKVLAVKPDIDRFEKEERDRVRYAVGNATKMWKDYDKRVAANPIDYRNLVTDGMRDFFYSLSTQVEAFREMGMTNELAGIAASMPGGFDLDDLPTPSHPALLYHINTPIMWNLFEDNLKKYAPWIWEKW